MKPKLIPCLELVLGGVLSGCVSGVRPGDFANKAEPRYLDKSLSEWIPLAEYAGSEIDLFRRRDERAYPAVLEIGTNALPWLLN